MKLVRWRVEFFCIVVSTPLILACVSSRSSVDGPAISTTEVGLTLLLEAFQSPVHGKQESLDQMKWADLLGTNSKNLPDELQALGVSRIEPVDLGFSGKMGESIVFVADKRLIPHYDRLYWAMIRVLSEKYGCFARKKIDRGELVAFKCRDQRVVTFRRRITEGYAVFKARQYRSDGRAIVMVNKRSKMTSGIRAVAKRP